jgi:SAM-dependent methyltransferase
MPLAYYAAEASRTFWEDHWAGRDLGEAVGIAERSPLTVAIEAALAPASHVLEAGCGLGQYVVLLRARGHTAVGVDWSVAGLRHARSATPPPPVAAMALDRLGLRPAVFDAYISLGVVEHDARGPDAILMEAHRVLRPGGTLIVSVPYVNGVRRLGAWWIRRANAAVARAGGAFYQFAFGRREFRRRLNRHHFRVVSAWPYDPARLLRRALGSAGRHRAAPTGADSAAGAHAVHGLVRRALYTTPVLSLLGHMILFVARRDDRL